MKKFIFLLLTLAIPVSIFLFLKIFGNNEFEVPVLFEAGIADCGENLHPHRIPWPQFVNTEGVPLNTQNLNGFLIFGVFQTDDESRLDEYIIQLVRIQDAFYEIGSPTFVLLSAEKGMIPAIIAKSEDIGLQPEHYHLGFLEHAAFTDFLKCGLGLQKNEAANLVLADPERRIRGKYDVMDLEQTEQLILELKILRKKV